MNKRAPWLPAAFFGALVGLVVGLGVESIVDPSGNRDATYTDSMRMLFILRYAAFGIVAGIAVWYFVERSRRARRQGSGLPTALAGAALVAVALAGAYPIANDEDPKPPANARAVFTANCEKLTAQDRSVSMAQSRKYCACLTTTFARDQKGDALKRLYVDVNRSLSDGTAAPAPALRAAEACVEKVGLR